MTEPPELPEDLDDWPVDPCQLLGVTYESSLRELRRAYARLTRRFKPEHHPEHFQRLCDAYESMKQYIELVQPDGSDSQSAAPQPNEHALRAAGQTDLPTGAPKESESDRLWQLARRGEQVEAYRSLCELHRQEPKCDRTCLRLYWLLTLWPKLDPTRDAAEFLADGLTANGLTGPLYALYLSRVERQPEEALSARCRRLLTAGGLPRRLLPLVDRRWTAAVPLENWNVIAADLNLLRPHVEDRDGDTWVRTLLSAVAHLVWMDHVSARQLAEALRRETESHGEAHLTLEDELDRIDCLLELVRQWRLLAMDVRVRGPFVPELCGLVRDSWNVPFDQLRRRWLQLLTHFGEDPLRALTSMDVVTDVSPLVVGQFYEQIVRLFGERYDFDNAPDKQHCEQLLGQWLRTRRFAYPEQRIRILLFVAENRMTIDDFVETLLTVQPRENRAIGQLARWLREDGALQCVCDGFHAFWGE